MPYLLLSIFFSTSLVVILRLFSIWKIKTEHGILFNYLVCCITGFIVMPDKTMFNHIGIWNGWWVCLLLGGGFILTFLLIGKSTNLLGVATTGIAFKLSFVIPTIVAILFYGDKFSITKMIGIAMAVFAVFLIADSKENNVITEVTEKISEPTDFIHRKAWIMPFLIFIGSGITDSIFNFIQRNYTPTGYEHLVTTLVFLGAFLMGLLLFGFNRELYQWKNVLGGILLGVPNYASLYFLLLALKKSTLPPSELFPINNLGIVGFTAICGLILFKEKFSLRKSIGFALALGSIIIIGFLS